MKRGKPVTHPKVRNVNTGKTYPTFKEAAEDIGGCRVCIHRCCNGIQYTHHGYRFIFVEEENGTEIRKDVH